MDRAEIDACIVCGMDECREILDEGNRGQFYMAMVRDVTGMAWDICVRWARKVGPSVGVVRVQNE